MTVFVFCGPTIHESEAKQILAAEYLPPAAQGDVLNAVARKPRAIGIIDGYFQFTPSVLHKEILWALDQGVHVFGSSSMGALRAAELHSFGMKGVGRIFEEYRDGLLTRDDEVALNHGPAELKYPSLSEPLVNIRATLEVASENKVISQETSDKLLNLMDQEYFSNRSYKHMLHLGEQHNVQPDELLLLERWLENNSVNQKKIDAIEMLKSMDVFLRDTPGPFTARFRLERTSIFDQLTS